MKSAGGARENCLTQAIPAWPTLSGSLRATAGSLFALVLALGAWGVFIASEASLGWRLAALLVAVYLIAIGALQLLLIDRFSAAFRGVEAERAEALRLSAERETMLAETQHRVANNLATISTMLSIQARVLGDGVARRAIDGAAGRIRVVGEVNRMFNRLTSKHMRIDDAFLEDLVTNCIVAFGAEERVQYETSIDAIDLPRRDLLSVALVLNECVNNALEHGFPGEARGTITIRLEASYDGHDKHRLTIVDDGVGPPAGFDSTEPRSAGLMFVNSSTRRPSGAHILAQALASRCAQTAIAIASRPLGVSTTRIITA